MSREPTFEADLTQHWSDLVGDHELDLTTFSLPGLIEAVTPPGLDGRPLLGSKAKPLGRGLAVHLELELLDPADERVVGLMHRTIDTNSGLVFHREFSLKRERNGLGLGRSATYRASQLYRALSLIEARVEAAEIGAYAWAMCGFDFIDSAERDRVVAAADELLRRMNLEADLGAIKNSWDFRLLDHRVAVSRVAAALPDGPPELQNLGALGPAESEVQLGKALLLASDHGGWSGRLDLNAKSAGLRQLARYCGLDDAGAENDVNAGHS